MIFFLESGYLVYFIDLSVSLFSYIEPSMHFKNEANPTKVDLLYVPLNLICKYFVTNILHLCSLWQLIFTHNFLFFLFFFQS